MAGNEGMPERSEAARLALSTWALERAMRTAPASERGRIMALRVHRRLLQAIELERKIPPARRSFLEIHDGAADACLLLHGATGVPADLRPLADHLHAGGFTVYGPRLPGAETSLADPPRVRWQADLQEALRAYSLLERQHRRVMVVGLSFGAALAIHLARHRQPAALALLAPALVPRIGAPARLLLRLRVHHLGWVRRRAGWNLELLEAMEKARARVPGLKLPIYAAHCEDDETISPMSVRHLQRKAHNPGSRFRMFASGGHAILRAHGEATLHQEILSFLASAHEGVSGPAPAPNGAWNSPSD